VGVPVVHELDGVGENLQDHLLFPMAYEAAPESVVKVSRWSLLSGVATWLFKKTGPFARSPIQTGGFVKTRAGLDRPDLQFHVAGLPPFAPNFDEPRPITYGSWMTIIPTLLRPKSRGTIRLRSKDPAAPPAIDPRYLSDAADLDTLVAGVKLGREIAATGALKGMLRAETCPGPEHQSDEALRARIAQHCDTIFHPVGTCAMGSVVDSELRVRGMNGLRIADASVMPTIPGGNTNAPVILVAERAAELIASTSH
jgi:choline dehydrogenase